MIALLLIAALTPAQKAAKYKLQPGAEGKLCLDCHADFQKKMQKEFVHTPVKGKDCTGCHNPHATEHGKLLAAEPTQICKTCHQSIGPADAKSTHKPVADGNCIGCHDPHASENKFELNKPGIELCASCHQAITDTWKRSHIKHTRAGDCATCHQPHGSSTGSHLLAADVPGLCLKCHAPGQAFLERHMNYPVQKSDCTSCHDPHGSDKAGMLYDTVHKPLAQRKCNDCHVGPKSQQPFATKASGTALCTTCHEQQYSRMIDKPQVHQAVLDDKACLNCHNPHATRQRGLISGNMKLVCGTCHLDTIQRQEKSVTKHKPVLDGDCTACHSPHSSEQALLMKRPDVVQMCGTCHDWQKHSTHPIGDKLKDKRNKNLTMNCLSCHRAHGTEYKHMNPYPTTTELCTKCHEQFKR